MAATLILALALAGEPAPRVAPPAAGLYLPGAVAQPAGAFGVSASVHGGALPICLPTCDALLTAGAGLAAWGAPAERLAAGRSIGAVGVGWAGDPPVTFGPVASAWVRVGVVQGERLQLALYGAGAWLDGGRVLDAPHGYGAAGGGVAVDGGGERVRADLSLPVLVPVGGDAAWRRGRPSDLLLGNLLAAEAGVRWQSASGHTFRVGKGPFAAPVFGWRHAGARGWVGVEVVPLVHHELTVGRRF